MCGDSQPMTILPARFAIALALAAGVSACTSAPYDATGTLFSPSREVRYDVTIRVPAGHRGDLRRYENGVITTLEVLGAWLTPFPDRTIAVAPETTPWWTSAASMAPETVASRATSRRYLERLMDTSKLPPDFADALVEYLSRRAVSKIVDREYLAVYRGRAEGRYFGGFVPRDLRVQLPVESGGDRALQTLDTLDRWVSRPVFDAVMAEFVTAWRGRRPALDDFASVASRVSGQNVAWLFDEVLRQGRVFDYAVDALDSRPEGDGRFHTTVTVRRHGDGIVPGPVPVVTTFAGGESVRETMSGRLESVTFEYRSAARAESAEVDPDRLLLVDRSRSNNGIASDRTAARIAANRWSARWMIWLEDALLTYVALT